MFEYKLNRMKKTLITLAMILPTLGFSQNGGITNESVSTKIEWLGITNGQYIVRVTNKQNCEVPIKIQWDNSPQSRQKDIGANLSDTFQINQMPTGCKLKAKPLSRCTSGGDMGWVEIDVCQILPVKFTNITGQRVGPRSVKLIFSAEEDGNTDHYNIQYSLDGKTFKTVNVLFPNGVVGGKQYSVIVNY
jgi:hypothetical protein